MKEKMSPRERALCRNAVRAQKKRSRDELRKRGDAYSDLKKKLWTLHEKLDQTAQSLTEADATIAKSVLDGDANNKRWAKIMYEASLVTAERDSLKIERDAMAVTISVLKTDAELFRDLLRHMMGHEKA